MEGIEDAIHTTFQDDLEKDDTQSENSSLSSQEINKKSSRTDSNSNQGKKKKK